MLLKNKKIILFFVFILLLAGMSFALKWYIIQEETPSVEKCTDSEGKNYYKKGVTKNLGEDFTDYCEGDVLYEYYCSNDYDIGKTTYKCPTSCQDGACLKEDTDKDGMDDEWEKKNGLDPYNLTDATSDSDNDGLKNSDEYTHNTDPNIKDTDDDGIEDGPEITYETDPLNPDSDDDGMPDGWEINNELNPALDDADRDPDDDKSTNLDEYKEGTDPHNEDTDGDGIKDGPDECPRTPEGVLVDWKGCTIENETNVTKVQVKTECAEWNKDTVSSGYQSKSCDMPERIGTCEKQEGYEDHCYYNDGINEICFPVSYPAGSANYIGIPLNKHGLADTVCAKGTGKTWLYDCDTIQPKTKHYCRTYCGYHRAYSGERFNFGEYLATEPIEECCGDDLGENFIKGIDGTSACCDSADDIVINKTCFAKVTTECAEWDRDTVYSGYQSKTCDMPKKTGLCRSEAYCYYADGVNEICLPVSYPVGSAKFVGITLDLKKDMPDSVCAMGTNKTWLYDCDTTQPKLTYFCEMYCGYRRAYNGESHNIGEYNITIPIEECCGDDLGENLVMANGIIACCDSSQDILRKRPDGSVICCDPEKDFNAGGKCVDLK